MSRWTGDGGSTRARAAGSDWPRPWEGHEYSVPDYLTVRTSLPTASSFWTICSRTRESQLVPWRTDDEARQALALLLDKSCGTHCEGQHLAVIVTAGEGVQVLAAARPPPLSLSAELRACGYTRPAPGYVHRRLRSPERWDAPPELNAPFPPQGPAPAGAGPYERQTALAEASG